MVQALQCHLSSRSIVNLCVINMSATDPPGSVSAWEVLCVMRGVNPAKKPNGELWMTVFKIF